MSKQLAFIKAADGQGIRFLKMVGPESAKWTTDKSKATKFDLNKLDKSGVLHFEKNLGLSIVLIPV